MAGYLHITEYSNMGDVATELPVEPASRRQEIRIGTQSAQLHPDTRMVALFATFPCRVAFAADGAEVTSGWPLSENVETIRLVRPNTRMHIVTRELEW